MNEELPVDSTNHVVFAKLDANQSEGSGEEEVLGYLEVQPSSDDNDTYYLQSQQIELDGEHVILAQGDEGGEIYVVVRADQEDPSQDGTTAILMQGLIEDGSSGSNLKSSEITTLSTPLLPNTSEKANAHILNSLTENGSEPSRKELKASNVEAFSVPNKTYSTQKDNQKLLQLACIAENQSENATTAQLSKNDDQMTKLPEFPTLNQHSSRKDISLSSENQAFSEISESYKSGKASGNIFEKLTSGKGWIDRNSSESEYHFEDEFTFSDAKESLPRTSEQTSRLCAMDLTQQVSDVLKVIDSSLEEAENLIAHDLSSHQTDKTDISQAHLPYSSPSKTKHSSPNKTSISEINFPKDVSIKVKESIVKEPLKESLKMVLSNKEHSKNISQETKPVFLQPLNDKEPNAKSSEISHVLLSEASEPKSTADHGEGNKDSLKNDEMNIDNKSIMESKRPKRKAAFQGVPKDLIKTKRQKDIKDEAKKAPSQIILEAKRPTVPLRDSPKEEESLSSESSASSKRPKRNIKSSSQEKKVKVENLESSTINSEISFSLQKDKPLESSSIETLLLNNETNIKNEDNLIKFDVDIKIIEQDKPEKCTDEKVKSSDEQSPKLISNKTLPKSAKGKLKDVLKQGDSPSNAKPPRKRKPLDKFDLLKRKKPPSFSPKSLLKFIKPLSSLITPISPKKTLKSKRVPLKTTKTSPLSRTSSMTTFSPIHHSTPVPIPQLPVVKNSQQPHKDATQLPGISETNNREILHLSFCDIRVRIQNSHSSDHSLTNTYSCPNCQFSTSRLNNIVFHHKFGCTSENSDFIWDLDQDSKKEEKSEEPSTPKKGLLATKKTLTPEKTKVKNPLEESDSEEEEEEDKDDKSSQAKLKAEDVVWVEWRSLHRPAWIQEVLPRGRRVIVNYIDSNAPKIGVKVHIKRISTFDNAERNKKYLSESKATPFGESVVKAVAKAEDFLRKRCLGYEISASQFFCGEGTFEISQDDPEETATSEVSDLEPETEEEKNDPVKRKERKKRINQKLLKIVKGGHVKSHLLGVYSTSLPSERHRKFHSISSVEKNALKHVSWFGPIDDEDQQEEIYEYCLGLFKSTCKYGKSYDIVAYMFEVWVPEAIVKAISRLKKVSLPEAEDMFVHNIPSTKELGSPSKCPLPEGSSPSQTANELLSLEF